MADAGRRHLTALRLSALGVAEPTTTSAGDTVRGLLAMQAQDYLGTLWAVGLRTAASTEADVDAAHAAGGFVRSWPMRGTLHFVAADDLNWMLSLTSARMIQTAAGRRRQLGLGDDDFRRAEAIARGRLSGGGRATRAELLAAFAEGGLDPSGQRGIHVLGQLAQLGILVLGARDAWVLLEEWVVRPRRLEPAEALREFALRYFWSHGPATVRDFAWWSSLTLTVARAALETAREQLDELEVDGRVYYLRPGLEPAPPAVHLLPGFDEYLLGYTDRSAQLASEHRNSIVPGGNGMFLSTVVVDGDVVGTWRRERKADRFVVTVVPFRPLTTTARRGVKRRLERYGDFLGTEIELSAEAGGRAR